MFRYLMRERVGGRSCAASFKRFVLKEFVGKFRHKILQSS